MNFKIFNLCLISFLSVITTNVIAANHTVSLGYAQTKVIEDIDLRGVNVQYRYEWDSPISLLTSATYQTASEKYDYITGYEQSDLDYFSVLVGPAYRFNEYLSAYVAGGFAHTTSDYSDRSYSGSYYDEDQYKETSFAFGLGLIANPTPNVSLNVGYERTTVDDLTLDGFNLGLGYRF